MLYVHKLYISGLVNNSAQNNTMKKGKTIPCYILQFYDPFQSKFISLGKLLRCVYVRASSWLQLLHVPRSKRNVMPEKNALLNA
jgi:hypothetical protein